MKNSLLSQNQRSPKLPAKIPINSALGLFVKRNKNHCALRTAGKFPLTKKIFCVIKWRITKFHIQLQFNCCFGLFFCLLQEKVATPSSGKENHNETQYIFNIQITCLVNNVLPEWSGNPAYRLYYFKTLNHHPQRGDDLRYTGNQVYLHYTTGPGDWKCHFSCEITSGVFFPLF